MYQNTGASLRFLQEVIHRRLKGFFKTEGAEPFSFPEIKLEVEDSQLNQLLVRHRFNTEEYVILLLSLAPQLQPGLIDNIVQQYLTAGGEFAEIGGTKGTNQRNTLPTGETALFILAGTELTNRMQASVYFSPDHFFAKENILSLETVKEGEPRMSGRLILQPEYIDQLSFGAILKPVFGPDFPAKHISTKMDWEDLVLNAETAQQLGDIKVWLDHNHQFMTDWGMDKRIKPGYRALFHGPPGTGKTLAATLLGKQFKKDVYRIDLSQVVSKYIGETEKNLEKIFNKAENKDWILFFDEADSLFGKRSNVQSAHDKYANQEVSYLLQRVEDFPGLIILASNFKSNIDQAFVRRFNGIIHFSTPTPAERLEIWKKSIPPKACLADDVDLNGIAGRFELTGSAIVSVIHYASLQTIRRNSVEIIRKDLLEGIKKEYEKEEKVFNI